MSLLLNRNLVVCEPADDSPITHEQVISPSVMCAGLNEPLAGFEPEAGAAIWVVRWADSLSVVAALRAGAWPAPTSLREAALHTIGTSLESVRPANELAC
jgi:hypothetical protein